MFRFSFAAAFGAALLGVPATLQAREAHADAAIIKVQHNHGAHSAVPAPAASSSVRIGSLLIEAPWTRATPAGAKVAGGYMSITNTGTAPDRLIGGSLALAGRFEVHEMAVNEGVMTMRQLAAGLEIAPGAKVELKPGGLHVMFMDLKAQLREGQPVRGTLVFEKAGTVEVAFTVAPIGARAPAAHMH
jgi:copper(I)-binding protein